MSVQQEHAREQLALDLAIKLHAGTATEQEMQQAADLLSYAIGERLRLERRVLELEAGQQVLAEYARTGDRSVIDDAYFKAKDRALVASDDFQESLGQMLRGEGRVIDPSEFGKKPTERTST